MISCGVSLLCAYSCVSMRTRIQKPVYSNTYIQSRTYIHTCMHTYNTIMMISCCVSCSVIYVCVCVYLCMCMRARVQKPVYLNIYIQHNNDDLLLCELFGGLAQPNVPHTA